MKKYLTFWLVSLVCVILVLSGSKILMAASKVPIAWGSTATTSGSFQYFVVASKILNEQIPENNITVRSTGGSAHNARLLETRGVELGGVGTSVAREMFLGLKPFEEKPYKDLRLLFVLATNPLHFVVTEESGIKDIYGLNGKKFSPVPQGSAVVEMAKTVFNIFNVRPDIYTAGMEDAVDAMKDNRIVGIAKLGRAPDSSILNIASTKKIRILSFSDTEIEKIVQNLHGVRKTVIPAGPYPGVGTFKTVEDQWCIYSRKDFPEEFVYKILKVHWTNREQMQRLAPLFIGEQFPSVTMEVKTEGSVLHSGAVKFYRELGYKVPEVLLPPEIK